VLSKIALASSNYCPLIHFYCSLLLLGFFKEIFKAADDRTDIDRIDVKMSNEPKGASGRDYDSTVFKKDRKLIILLP